MILYFDLLPLGLCDQQFVGGQQTVGLGRGRQQCDCTGTFSGGTLPGYGDHAK